MTIELTKNNKPYAVCEPDELYLFCKHPQIEKILESLERSSRYWNSIGYMITSFEYDMVLNMHCCGVEKIHFFDDEEKEET